MVGCHHVVEHAQTVPLLCFKEPMEITAPITCFRKKWNLVLSVSLPNGLNGAQRLNGLNDWNELFDSGRKTGLLSV